MRVYVLSDCRAAVTSAQQVRWSPANGNVGSDFLTWDWIADSSTHGRKGIFPTFCEDIASAAEDFPPITDGDATHLLNGFKTETEYIFSPQSTAEIEKVLDATQVLASGLTSRNHFSLEMGRKNAQITTGQTMPILQEDDERKDLSKLNDSA